MCTAVLGVTPFGQPLGVCLYMGVAGRGQFQELNAETVMGPVTPQKAFPYQPQTSALPMAFLFQSWLPPHSKPC